MVERLNIHELSAEGIDFFKSVEKYLVRAHVDRSLHHLIEIRASQINGCARCLKIHTKAALEAGETNERIFVLGTWRHTNDFTPKEQAVLALTESVTLISKEGVPDAVFNEVKKFFSDREISDLIIAICMINTWNRINVSGNQL